MRLFGGTLSRVARCFMRAPRRSRIALANLPDTVAGREYAGGYREQGGTGGARGIAPPNPLERFFDDHREGPGLWKWRHYFEIYHRHLARFVGEDIHFAEVGVFSGGSLRMWRSYFGEGAHIHGIDLDASTSAYRAEKVSIHIGDQEDRGFWDAFRRDVPALDVIVDDGGHTPGQQRVTLEEMLPHLRSGGVYICEDIHHEGNAFQAFVAGLCDQMNAAQSGMSMPTTPFQAAIASIHVYPFVVVIEKRAVPLPQLRAERHGTEWQPPNVVREGYGPLQGRGS
jgi:hypothetical protein